MGEIHEKKQFCPLSSIMDACPTGCRDSKSAVDGNEGLEWGNMDVTVRDGEARPPWRTTMIYRVEVVPTVFTKGTPAYPVQAGIRAYLQVGQEVLINVGDLQGRDALTEQIKVNLFPGADTPLQATQCLRNMTAHVMSAPGINNWVDYIAQLKAPTDQGKRVRQGYMNLAFQKGLGDGLQELNAVMSNGGYTGEPGTQTDSWTQAGRRRIVSPNDGRLILSNDRPSGTRSIFLTLYGQGDINPNCMGGFMTSTPLAEKTMQYWM